MVPLLLKYPTHLTRSYFLYVRIMWLLWSLFLQPRRETITAPRTRIFQKKSDLILSVRLPPAHKHKDQVNLNIGNLDPGGVAMQNVK